MRQVLACIDGIGNTTAVCDYAAWAARRLVAPLTYLHVIERHPERAASQDLSGSIGIDEQEALLKALADLDAERSQLAQAHGRALLASARQRAAAAGIDTPALLQQHGELVEVAQSLEADARLFVLGQHYHATQMSRIHLDHHVERVIRAVSRPVLVVTGDRYTAPSRAVIAYDGSTTARKMVDTVAGSPLLHDLPCHIVMAGDDTAATRASLQWAAERLTGGGFAVDTAVVPGEPERALARYVGMQNADLLVMGAYGHSRIRHLIVGSTTTTMLRTSAVPVLILR